MGLAARNSGKSRCVNRLREIVVFGENVRDAVQRFPNLLHDELNVRKVTFRDTAHGPLLETIKKPNLKKLGQKYGSRLPEVKAAIEAEVQKQQEGGQATFHQELMTPSGPIIIEADDLWVDRKAPEGWAGAAEGAMEVMVDVRITEELALAGMAREVVRHVQELRKSACLEMEDRIVLYLGTDGAELQKAIDAHRDVIAAETLTASWAEAAPNGEAHRATVKIEGQALAIALTKATVKGS